MRTMSRLLLSTLSLIPVALCPAQEKSLQPAHAPDGGTIERFASIAIPSTPGAPFMATVNTEWIRRTPDGSNITLVNRRTVARDTHGRTYQERAYFVPNDGRRESVAYQTEISDPAARATYICRKAERVCRLEAFAGAANSSFRAAASRDRGNEPGLQVESLGTQNISGLETIGSRETRLIETETVGNDSPILERKEFWYSPALGINVVTKREEPRFSTQQSFEVTDITLSEPDAKLFAPPPGYKILDLRNPPEIPAAQSSSPQ